MTVASGETHRRTGSKVYAALRTNDAIEPAGTEHMKMIGAKLPGALAGLPTQPQL